MTNEQCKAITTRLSPIIGTPLQGITRVADMVCFQFGNLIEKDALYRDESGHAAVHKVTAGEYALHVQCCFRIPCGNTIVVAKSDLFQPSKDYVTSHGLNKEDAIPNDFDYDVAGNSRMDEVFATTFNQPAGFLVESVKANPIGDLHIAFTNGFLLDVLTDISGGEECWRFFKHGDEKHLVVTGQGLAADEANDE